MRMLQEAGTNFYEKNLSSAVTHTLAAHTAN